MKIPLAFISPDAYERPDICTPCGGVCCKTAPGITLPIDWGAPDEAKMRERLVEALSTGKWCIDWWEGDCRGIQWDEPGYLGKGYYIRPAIKGSEGRLRHPSWGGECTMLTPTGCSLTRDERPTQCRGMIPHGEIDPEDNKPICNGIATDDHKRSYAIAWLPYHALIMSVTKGKQS